MGLLDFLIKERQRPPDGKALCDAMNAVANSDNDQTRNTLYHTLLNSWFHIPTPELPPEMKQGQGVTRLETGAKVQFAHVRDRDGRIIFPVFTDAEALKNWDPNTPSFAMPASEYFQIVSSLKVDEIRVNPYDPIRKPLRPGGSITRREFELLAQGQIPCNLADGGKVKAGQQVMIGKPAKPLPYPVLARLTEACEKLPIIRKGIYAFMMIPPEPPTHALALIFETGVSEEQKHACFQTISENIRSVLPPGGVITYMAAEGTLAERFQNSGTTLFIRE